MSLASDCKCCRTVNGLNLAKIEDENVIKKVNSFIKKQFNRMFMQKCLNFNTT